MKKTSLEGILRDHFGCNNPVLKEPKTFVDYDGYDSKRYLTVSGCKAYSKLISLLYDLKELVDSGINFDVDEIIEDLDSIAEGWNIGLKEGGLL